MTSFSRLCRKLTVNGKSNPPCYSASCLPSVTGLPVELAYKLATGWMDSTNLLPNNIPILLHRFAQRVAYPARLHRHIGRIGHRRDLGSHRSGPVARPAPKSGAPSVSRTDNATLEASSERPGSPIPATGFFLEKGENARQHECDHSRRNPTAVFAHPPLRTPIAGARVECAVRAVIAGNGLP